MLTEKFNDQYVDAVNYLYSISLKGINKGLDRLLTALNYWDNPHLKIPSIIIGGTNGKGSVSSIINSVLIESGLKTGLYTSPHLHSIRERIQINNELISKQEFVERVEEVRKCLLNNKIPELTFFEIMTLIAFLSFADHKLDINVLEVGLGGRWDATAVAKTLIVAVTNVELDHMNILGKTRQEIAREKFALYRQSAISIGGDFTEEVEQIFNEYTSALPMPVLKKNRDFFCSRIDNQIKYTSNWGEILISGFPLNGKFQLNNLAVAFAVIQSLKKYYTYSIEDSAVNSGIEKVKWPARMESINKYGRNFLVDVAHNPAGINALVESLDCYSYKRLITVFGCLKDKDSNGMLDILTPYCDKLIITKPPVQRGKDIDSYNLTIDFDKFEDIKLAIDKAVSIANQEDLILITGSIYTVSEARRILLNIDSDLLITL